jgi:hypothetical protein
MQNQNIDACTDAINDREEPEIRRSTPAKGQVAGESGEARSGTVAQVMDKEGEIRNGSKFSAGLD